MTNLARFDSQGLAGLPPALRARRILVIGYGNPGRQDDGLGPAAAAEIGKVGWPNVTAADNYQLTIEDAIDLAAHDVVWFVDAAISGDEACAVRRLVPAFDMPFTSHLLKPEALLAIADQQFGARPEAYLLSIRGYAFDFREGLSDRANDNLRVAVTLLCQRIGLLSGDPQ
ncbi:MAG TPA: hydrogenase maturation protease [Rhodopila sp.]|uniref:hydrogenase maturation protease n=1 Tax=Rhodopila sp. TaxID=2480087 RepID=UPI002C491150|nr:hydrogenase maturation protease [Rhodopila sp.]HVY15132.1 hydrogenase maturation protease [Rhodopila sp.]